MGSPIEILLLEVFRAQGAVDAPRLASKAAEDYRISQRNAEIYQLRATMTEQALASRFELTVRRVRQIVKHQKGIR